MKQISLVILVYNEAEIIEKVINDFYKSVIMKIPGSEFIVAEDGSTDGTKEILQKISQKIPIRLVSGEERKGYTRAMRDAFGLPRNDIVFLSDSDAQHDPGDFWKLLDKLNEGYDMVIGYKSPRIDPWYRLFISRVFNRIIGIMFGVNFHDINCGFRLMKRDLVRDILRDNWALRACISAELTLRAVGKGYRVAEVSVTHYPRETGESRGLPLKKIPGAIVHILRGFRTIKRDISAKK